MNRSLSIAIRIVRCRLVSRGFPSRAMAIVLVCCAVFVPSNCRGRELITDGGFDNLAEGWDSDTDGSGDWFLSTVGNFTPLSFLPTSDEGGGQGGYVVSDQQGPTMLPLFQVFNVPPGGTSVVLSYDMFVNDWSNQTSFNPTQHARVDLLRGQASPFNTDTGVLFNMYLGTDGGPRPNAFVHYEFDITPFVREGGDFQIRFLTVDSFNNINQGVDNVSVQFVPEPAALWLVLLGALTIGPRGLHGRRSAGQPKW